MYEYKAVIRNVRGGDVFDVDIDLGYHVHCYKQVRLAGVELPDNDAGIAVTAWAQRFINTQCKIKCETESAVYLTFIEGEWKNWDCISLYNLIGINKLNKETYNENKCFKLVNKNGQ